MATINFQKKKIPMNQNEFTRKQNKIFSTLTHTHKSESNNVNVFVWCNQKNVCDNYVRCSKKKWIYRFSSIFFRCCMKKIDNYFNLDPFIHLKFDQSLFIYLFILFPLVCVRVFFYLLLFMVMKTVVCWSKLHAKLTHHAGSSYFFLALHTHKDDQLHHHIDIYESLLWLIYIVCTSIDSSLNEQVIQIKIIGESFFFFFHFLIFTI